MVQMEESFKICINESLQKNCECSVCFDIFKDAAMTKCGHTFCKVCIDEIVDIQHKCPVCKAELHKQDITKNYQLSMLIDSLQKEREKAKQKFF